MTEKTYIVMWEECHVFRYQTTVTASSRSEALAKVPDSSEEDDARDCEFQRVKSVGRKRVFEVPG